MLGLLLHFDSYLTLTYLVGSNIYTMENDFELQMLSQKNDPELQKLDPEEKLELQRLNQICLPRWDKRIKTFTLRPERPEYAILMQEPPSEKWIRVLRHFRRVKCCAHNQKLRNIGEELPVCRFLDKMGRFDFSFQNLTLSFQFAAAILFDQQCSGSARNLEEPYVPMKEEAKFDRLIRRFYCRHGYYMRKIIPRLFEHMLLIDYGIDQADDLNLDTSFTWRKWPKRVLLDFDDLCSGLIEWAQCFPVRFCHRFKDCLDGLNPDHFDFSDVAIMLYYYNTHRKPLNPVDYRKGMTGYFGVLQELISEVPLRGTDRLQRKLSVDINELIPKTVKDPIKRQKMVSIVRNIATQYNLPLYRDISSISKPLFETRYKGGFQRRNWGTMFKDFWSCSYSEAEGDGWEPLIDNRELLISVE